jgi:CRP-like cAMP-binding protein
MNNPLIAYLQLFRSISPEDQERISRSFESRTFKEGSELFRTGHICRELFFICNGVLKIVVRNEKGNDVIHFFLKENKFCTIRNSFDNDVIAEESILAACDTEVMAISKTRLEALYSTLPNLKVLIDQITQQALLEKIRIRNAYLGQDSAMRYQLFMMREPEVALRVALGDVASYLGITPQSLSRIRKNIH